MSQRIVSSQRSMRRASLASSCAWRVVLPLALILAACGDPVLPRASVTTFDDPGTGAFVAVSAGREHTCALDADALAYCWGSNEFLQVGAPRGDARCTRPSDARNVACVVRPVPVAGGLRFSRISAGGSHSCGLGEDRRVYCWGDNLNGQLGTPSVRESFTPVPVDGDALFMDVAAGGSHSCGLRTDGTIMCWGVNESGQLGLGTIGGAATVPTAAITAVRLFSISASEHRTCGRSPDGDSYCWGSMWVTRDRGRDVYRAQSVPFPTPNAPPFQSLSVGVSATCGVSHSNAALCWDANATGTFGNGTVDGSAVPVQVRGDLRFVSISSGFHHTCAISVDGAAFCWGADDHGQLGVASQLVESRCRNTVPCSLQPIRVAGWRVFSQISAGLGSHSCALASSRHVYCWGAGALGQRGDSSRFDASYPIRTMSSGV
jgi:alpha-tubulin suppressor-like RCC1 family protein